MVSGFSVSGSGLDARDCVCRLGFRTSGVGFIWLQIHGLGFGILEFSELRLQTSSFPL